MTVLKIREILNLRSFRKAKFLSVALVVSGGSLFADQAALEQIFSQLDTNGDEQIQLDEVPPGHSAFAKRIFEQGDLNGDSIISKAEFMALLGGGEMTQKETSKDLQKPQSSLTLKDDQDDKPDVVAGAKESNQRERLEALFHKLDKNQDGLLQLAELSELMRQRLSGAFASRQAEALTLDQFVALGAQLTPEGRRRPIPNPVEIQATPLPEVLSEQNRNRERHSSMSLKFEEFAIIKLLDTNGDGQLSREELAEVSNVFDRLDANSDGFIDGREIIGLGAKAPKQDAGKINPLKSEANKNAAVNQD